MLTSIKVESNLPDDKAAVSFSTSLLIVALTEASRPPKALAGASQTCLQHDGSLIILN